MKMSPMTSDEITPSRARLEKLRDEVGPGPLLAGEDWDACGLMRFPDIEAFLGLALDPEYQVKAPAIRAGALERTLLVVTEEPGN